jgi:hypothetical protein
MEPPISPLAPSTHWVITPGNQLLRDLPDATLAVRLGMAFNAVMAQHRFAISTLEMTGIAAARDSFAALAVASALTEETLILINGNHRRVMELAKLGEADDDLLARFRTVNSGRSRERQTFGFVRNKLTFHWDAEAVEASLKDFADHESVIWLESTGRTTRETVMRLSADALLNAIFPIPDALKPLPPAERVDGVKAATRERMMALLDAMLVVSGLIEHAVAGYLAEIRAQQQQR